MKKILIITVTAGNAHNACAIGMKQKLESMGEVEVKIIDLLKEYSTSLNTWVADKGYCLAVSKLLKTYNMFFRHYQKCRPENRYKCPSQDTIISTVDGLMKEILTFQPDVIYCTHFYGAIALTNLKLVYDIPCKTMVTNLDYVNHPFWEACIGVDYFAIPNEDFIAEFEREGFRKSQLLPVGLPADDRSREFVDKKEARRQLGLDEDLFTIMVMFGGGYWSGGLKIFQDLIKALKGRKAQVVMINGKNKKGFEQIAKMKFEDGIKVHNVGFTYEVPLYLSASDIILNKCGGACVTEMVNKGIPMLITEKLPEQEIQNLKYLKSKGVALSFKSAKELKENLYKLMDNPKLLKQMSERTVSLRKNATEDLANLIMAQPKADYSKLLSQNVEIKKVKKQVRRALSDANRGEKRTVKQVKKVKKVRVNI